MAHKESTRTLSSSQNDVHPIFQFLSIDELRYIFSYIPPERANWFNVMLTCKLFLEAGMTAFDPSINNNRPIVWSISKNNVHAVRKLIKDKRVDPSPHENLLLRWVCAQGHTDIAEQMIDDPRVDLSSQNHYPIRIASWHGHIGIVKLLLKKSKVNPAAENNYAIRWARFVHFSSKYFFDCFI